MLDEKKIAELKAKHGNDLEVLEHAGVEIIVRPPDRAAWRRFRSMGADDQKKIDAGLQLVRDCCVHPSPEELEALLLRLPGLAETFAGELAELAGFSQSATRRKL